jgi:hypothetical protein
MKNERIIWMLLFLFSGVSYYAQNPFIENTTWATSERIDKPFEEITFRKINQQDYSLYDYYQIHFLPENKFYAFNIPGCGIDCVVLVYGTYFSTDTTVQFTINKINRIKGCNGEDTIKTNIGTYYWLKDKYSLRLVKDVLDEPKENYFQMLNISFEAFNNEEEAILDKYIYLYNKIYQIVHNKNTKKYYLAEQQARNWLYNEAYKCSRNKTDSAFHELVTDLYSKLEDLYSQLEAIQN